MAAGSRARRASLKPTVLVTDGEQRAALAIVRSLGRAGYKVYVCSVRRDSIAGASRYCAGTRKVSDPLRHSAAFLSEVQQIVTTIGADILLPVSEASLLVILPNRDALNCVIPFPTASAFERVCDKRVVLETARSIGIHVPRQVVLARREDLEALEPELLFPVVIKPSRTVTGAKDNRIQMRVRYAATLPKLRVELDALHREAYPVLLQQMIDGSGLGVSLLVWDGELIAGFSHRRIREKPPSGGVSVLRQSVPLDEALLVSSGALLKELAWQGVAMVEYKVENTTGIPYLMEINGRFWGSLQLAIDAGVDFPRLLVEAALGAKPVPVTTYDTGVQSRWEWGEVDHLVAKLRAPAGSAPDSGSGRMRRRLDAVSQFVRGFGEKSVNEVFRRDDPRPFFRESIDWICRR